ncbi:MAG TPA: hypothetical protein RMH99_29140 [Sandaracinaceae bacterium LLY-WYZ-13_1]|nr:hypothetical protein [Sandaracinaceae bacterium LLY-WYZ-13_1]
MRRLLITMAALVTLAACGPGEIGQECQGAAIEEDCVDGAICTPTRSETAEPLDDPNSEIYVCRQICEVQADCTEPGMECRRVVGSMVSSCQPDDDASDPMDPMEMD